MLPETLTSLNYCIYTKKLFVIYKKFNIFKKESFKLLKTKLKYWFDDYYTDGKDRLYQNYLITVQCSINSKL